MEDPRKPEKAIDGLLAHRLRQGADRAAEACPDAEILAAYCDHSLPRPETARWDAHFATCSRCQAQLATLVRSYAATDLAPSAGTERSTWDRATSLAWSWNWRWVAPVATAAVVVLALWVVDPASLVNRSPSPETGFLELETDQATPAASAPDAEERLQNAETVLAEPELAAPRSELDQAERDALAAEAQGRLAQRANEANEAAGAPQMTRAAGEQEALSKLESEPAERALQEQSSAAADERADDQLPESPVLVDSFQTSRAREVSEDRAVQFGVASGVGGAVVANRAAEVRIASPTLSILWRLGASGRIERSADAGTTWNVQTDAGVELLAGSAPSELICWVVGRAGTVLRTTNGERWERATAPTDDDLVGVDAQNAINATVIGADGSRHVTTDGGRTWTLGAGR